MTRASESAKEMVVDSMCRTWIDLMLQSCWCRRDQLGITDNRLVVHFLIDAMQAGPMQTQGLFKLSILICMIIFLFLFAFVNGAYLLLLVSQIKLDTH
jgi:hypothetical protein